MSFTDVFGGNTIYPAEPSYLALALTADVELEWPIEQAISGLVLAKIIDVTPSGPGFSITFPDARVGSTGYVTTFYNAGADDFDVLDSTGGAILTVGSGEAWNVYSRDNTTAAGLWRIFQMGAGTSAANAATLAGAGLVAISTSLNEEMEVSNKAVDYVIVDGDRAKVITWTGGSGNFTLPDPATVGANWFVWIKNNGSGSVTITPAAGTIDGSGSLILATQESTALVSNGTNYMTTGFGQSTSSAFDFISIDVSGSGDFTLTGAQLNRVSYEFTGVLSGNRNIIVPAAVQQYWVDNATSGAFSLTVKTAAGAGVVVPQGQRRILYCDGVDVVSAETFAVSTPVSVTQGGTGLITVAQGDMLYGSATDVYSLLAKSALATRYLSNTGASNNPAWAQVNVSNGVTGTLPIANGGTGQATANAAINALLPSQGGNAGEFLSTDGTNTLWTPNPAAITTGSGTLNLTGMTGAVTATINWILIGNMVMFNVAQASGTSNTTALTATGWPAAITPAVTGPVFPLHSITDNSVLFNGGLASLNTAGTLTVLIGDPASATGFTAANNKGWTQWSGAYYLQ